MARLCSTEGLLLLLLLGLALVLSAEATDQRPTALRRTKREWILPPAKLMENTDYTNREFIAKIRSDKETNLDVKYYLSGSGADRPPYNLFVVDHTTGYVRVTAKLDREKTPFFNLSGRAVFNDGTPAEDDIPLNVVVLDMNDNTPYFELHTGNISEASKKGTLVMQIQGKDDDEAGTDNSKISYSIASQEPQGRGHMFTIDKQTGKVYVKEATLDRETCDFYKLVVHGSDMGGAPGGLTGTGTVEIRVLDINDNIPTLEKSEYNGKVDENVADVVVMRIKALDNDLVHTDNWVTVFEIAKGNENNLFSIETDRETNEGILKLIKAVDFEEVKNLELGLVITNVAPFVEGEAIQMDVDVQVGEGGGPLAPGASGASGAAAGASGASGAAAGASGASGAAAGAGGDAGVGLGADLGVGQPGVKPGTKPPAKNYPIKIAVNNVPEGPAFIPDTKKVPVSEDPKEAPKDGVITVFAAVDPDTGKAAEDVSYAKAYDPGNWFTIDKETAEIKLLKVPDRESPFLVNGSYIAKILAITKDLPPKTATGTIAIQVLDHNDHCPTLTTTRSTLCSDVKTVNVTGYDEDVSPNAAPFTFRIIPEGTRGKWDVEVINETSAALHSHEALWPGSYQLQVEVVDAKGLSCPENEIFTVDVCTCVDTGDCMVKAARLGSTSSKLSASAIGLMLVAMCLLLFILLLLLFCQCGGADTIFPDQFSDLPFGAKEHLMSYHTEGRGEDKEVPLQSVPIKLGTQKKVERAPVANFNMFPSKITGNQKTTIYDESVYNFQETSQSFTEVDNIYRFSRELSNYGNGSAAFGRQKCGTQYTTSLFDDIALSDAFLKDYYSQKSMCAVPLNDGLLEYGFEGQGSSAGSVGCCSLLEADDDLHFLDDLGFKFKTLAEICSPPTPTPTPVLTHAMAGAVKTTVNIVEPVVKPKMERSVETKHIDIKTEKVMSSTNISKSSIRTVSTALPPMTLPPSKVTNISHSSNISHSASLPRQTQTVILQQQPVYYTTSPVLQPMHYVVQPRLQNTVLLADGAPKVNLPGMYVVSGSQSTSSGFLIRGPQGSPSGPVIQGTQSPKRPVSPASPVSPSLLLPGGLGVPQVSVPAEGLKIVGPNPDGTYMLVKEKSSLGEVEGVDPGSPQGTLPRGAILVKEAVPPQGVLGPAAQGSVYGILPGHTVAIKGGVVAVNNNVGQTWVGQPGQVGLGPVPVFGVGVGQPRMGMGHVVTVKPEVRQAGIWPAGINPVGIRQVSVNQFQGIQPLKQTPDAGEILKACKIDSPKQDKITSVVNTIITAETAKTHQPSKEEGIMKNLFNDDSDLAQDMHDDTVQEKQDVITYKSEHDTTLHEEEPSTEGNVDRQEAAPSKDDEEEEEEEEQEQEQEQEQEEGKQLSIIEGPKDRSPEVGLEPQSNKVTDYQSDRDLEEDVSPIEKIVSKVESNQVIAITDSMQAEETIEGMTPVTSDEEKVVREQLLDSEVGLNSAGDELSATPPNEISTDTVNVCEERSIPKQEAMPELKVDPSEGNKIDQGQAKTDILDANARTSLQTVSPILTNQQEGDLDDSHLISEEVQVEGSNVPTISTLEHHLQTNSSPGHKEEDDDQLNITSESGVDEDQVNADAASISDGEREEGVVKDGGSQQSLSTSGDQYEDIERQHALSSQIENISDDYITDEEEGAVEEMLSQVQHNIGFSDDQDEDSAEEDASCTSSQVDHTLMSDDNLNVPEKEEEETLEEVALSIQQNVSITNYQDEEIEGEAESERYSPLEDQHIADGNMNIGEKEEHTVEEVKSPIQPHLSISNDEEIRRVDAGSVIYQVEDQFIPEDNIRDGAKEEDIVEFGVSKQSLSTFDDQYEDIERQHALSSQIENTSYDYITDEEKDKDAVEEMVLQVQHTKGFLDDQDEDSASCTSSQVDHTLMSDDNINVPEKEEEETLEEVALSTQQNVNITDYQDEEMEGEAVSERNSPLEDQHIADGNMDIGEKEEQIVEEVTSPIQPHLSISNDEEIRRVDAGNVIYQVEDQFIPEGNIRDGEKEEDIVEQEGDLDDSHLISEEVQVEGSNVPTISTLEHHLQTDNSPGHKEEDDDQLNITSESGVDEDQVNADADSNSDGEREEGVVEDGGSQQSLSTSGDQYEDTERQHALSSQIENTSDDYITDEEKDEDAVEKMALQVQHNICFLDDQDEDSASCRSSQVDHTLMSDDNINVLEKEEEETLEEVALSTQQNVNITDYQDEEMEEIGRVDAGSVIYQVEDPFIPEDNIKDGVKEDIVEEEVSPEHQTTFNSDEDSEEDASHTVSQVEELISNGSVSDGEKEAPYIQQNIRISDDQDGGREREDATGTSSHIEEEGIKSFQQLEEDSHSLETGGLHEEALYLASQHAEMNQVAATSTVIESQEMPCEVTTHHVRQGIDSSQRGDITLDIPERQDAVGQVLVRGVDMDDVVTSSEELRPSRVATGQVSMFSENKEASGRKVASGQVAEGETTQSDFQNTDIIQIEQSEGGDLTLEKVKAEVTSDLGIREGLDNSATNASGQVSPTSDLEIRVVDQAISSVLETDPGSAGAETASFIATSEVAVEAGYFVQNESVHMTGEAAGVGPNTVGKDGSIEVVSEAPNYMHGAEASGGEVSPVRLQTVISQTPRSKSRKSKKDSNKDPQSPKRSSGKCKQQ
ncbi:hypothetical protein EPR50_G00095520 [Perca flavescens]|uniref:Cadherin domain-containing protein n=1 Tax=Perca flavescens TaxID=8167 RepID=A0A484CZ14_PERFV|nr:hypothetical protein EPR50_G00095520 [Perca flavescens]